MSPLHFARNSAQFALSFVSMEVRGVQAAAYLLALSSIASSLLALIRDRTLAHLFGAGTQLDLYYAAFRLPDLLFIAVGALVSAFVLIPELSRRTVDEQRRYIESVVVGFAFLVMVVGSIVALAAPLVLERMFPMFASQLSELTALTRILLVQAVLLGFSNIAAAITQHRHRYALYALSPLVYNLGIIGGATLGYPHWGLTGLVAGVVVGAFLHLGIQLPAILRDGFFRRIPQFDFRACVDTVRASLPRTLALSMNNIAFFVLLSFAGTLSAGSISVFMFAFNMQNIPLSIIGASYATAAFPTLARAYSSGANTEYASYVVLAARHILFWSLPMIALLIVLRAHVVRVVLGSGAFDWADTRLTAAALALFALSLAAQGLVLLLIRALYAARYTALPLAVSVVSALLSVALAITLLGVLTNPAQSNFLEALLRVEDVSGTLVLALPLAYSLAALFSALLLALFFSAQFGAFFREVGRSWWESLTAAFMAGSAAYITLNVLGTITLASTLGSVLLKGGVAGCVGAAAATCTYWLMRNRELEENAIALKRRIWRDAEPIASGEQSA